MKRNTSDQIGRALEYAIAQKILNACTIVKSDKGTIADQIRDAAKFSALSMQDQQRYQQSASKIYDWLTRAFGIDSSKPLSMIRLADESAVKGDVTDIRLLVDEQAINLSIKHNHTALKHQRPRSTAQHCGYAKGSEVDYYYRQKFKEIDTAFKEKAHTLSPTAQRFTELKDIAPSFVDVNLYKPACSLVATFLNEYASKENHAQAYFDFLVGNCDYHKIVVYRDRIEIKQFASLPKVTGLKASVNSNSYVDLVFSNGWEIRMRLHTASSRMAKLPLKFDSQPKKIEVPTLIISL